MRIAYVGHTRPHLSHASRFFTDFLESQASEVLWFADHRWRGETALDLQDVLTAEPDIIVVWQVTAIARALMERPDAPRVVFAPMYDSCHHLGDAFWRAFRDSKRCRVISFSDTLHAQLTRAGVWSARMRYFPNPAEIQPVDFSSGLRGFFWQPHPEPSRETIRTLTRNTDFAGMHIHVAPHLFSDGEAAPSAEDDPDAPLVATNRFKDNAPFDAALRQANVVFAPSGRDGVGTAMLEAMARGQCVAAPDQPTMNENLTHGLSGLLYDLGAPRPLDFSAAAQIGQRARELVEIGYLDWAHDVATRLPAIVFDDGLDLEDGAYQDRGFWAWRSRQRPPAGNGARRSAQSAVFDGAAPDVAQPAVENAENVSAPETTASDVPFGGACAIASAPRAYDRAIGPVVTVAIVTFNAEDAFDTTLDSIVGQTYPNIEIVVVDGASDDRTVQRIRRREAAIDCWLSEADHGPYDAMNKAARLGAGDFIIYINAGDAFYAPDSVALAIRRAAEHNALSADFLVGHHFYLASNGAQEVRKAADFEWTWARMTTGDYSTRWIDAVPGHQATFTRRQLLVEQGGYDLSYRIAADHAFMYAMRAAGARFHNLDVIIAVYAGGGISARQKQACAHEWWKIARQHGVTDAVDPFFATWYGPQSLMDPKRYETVRDKIRASGLFFQEWYRQRYMPNAVADADAIAHFVMFGAAKGANPSPLFDTRFYAKRAGEGATVGYNPLLHYIDVGAAAGRATRDWTDDADPVAALGSRLAPNRPAARADDDVPAFFTPRDLAEILGRA